MRCAQRLVAVVGVMLGTAVMTGAAAGDTRAAGGDPANGKTALTIPSTCEGRSLEFVLSGGGHWTPGHVVGSNELFHPTAIDISGTFIPHGGEPQHFAFQASKSGERTGHQERLVICSFEVSGTTEGGSFTANGTRTGFFSSRGSSD